jgi:hypothetical protein
MGTPNIPISINVLSELHFVGKLPRTSCTLYIAYNRQLADSTLLWHFLGRHLRNNSTYHICLSLLCTQICCICIFQLLLTSIQFTAHRTLRYVYIKSFKDITKYSYSSNIYYLNSGDNSTCFLAKFPLFLKNFLMIVIGYICRNVPFCGDISRIISLFFRETNQESLY